jgi:hypothetical protein
MNSELRSSGNWECEHPGNGCWDNNVTQKRMGDYEKKRGCGHHGDYCDWGKKGHQGGEVDRSGYKGDKSYGDKNKRDCRNHHDKCDWDGKKGHDKWDSKNYKGGEGKHGYKHDKRDCHKKDYCKSYDHHGKYDHHKKGHDGKHGKHGYKHHDRDCHKPAHHAPKPTHAAPAPVVAPVVHAAPVQHVSPAATSGSPKALAYTGSDVSLPLTVGLVALGLGSALALAGRRREETTV